MNRPLSIFASLLLVLTPLALRADDTMTNDPETAAPATAAAPTSQDAAANGAANGNTAPPAEPAGGPLAPGQPPVPPGSIPGDPNLPAVVDMQDKPKRAETEGISVVLGACPSGQCFRRTLDGTGGLGTICDYSNVKGTGPGRIPCIGASSGGASSSGSSGDGTNQ